MADETSRKDDNNQSTLIAKDTSGEIKSVDVDTDGKLLTRSTVSDINGTNASVTQFSELQVTNKTPIVELKGSYGFSALRDIKVENGSATVTNAVGDGQYELATTADGADSAILESAERGRYIPGHEGQAGINVRTSADATGNQVYKWGYYDGTNGFGFGQDSTGIFVFDQDDGVETKVYQSSWNVDTYSGLDLTDGHIFQIDFSYYGSGTVAFSIQSTTSANVSTQRVVHRLKKTGQLSIKDPNQHIRAEIDNNGTATASSIFVAGRQFSVLGSYRPNFRINAGRRLSLSGIGTTFLPLVSFRKKSAYESASVKLAGFDIISDADLVYEIRVGASLTSASFGTPTNTTATETACEVDNSATAITGGNLLNAGLVQGSNARSSVNLVNLVDVDVPNTDIVTLAVRRISSTNATASSVFRWREEW